MKSVYKFHCWEIICIALLNSVVKEEKAKDKDRKSQRNTEKGENSDLDKDQGLGPRKLRWFK